MSSSTTSKGVKRARLTRAAFRVTLIALVFGDFVDPGHPLTKGAIALVIAVELVAAVRALASAGEERVRPSLSTLAKWSLRLVILVQLAIVLFADVDPRRTAVVVVVALGAEVLVTIAGVANLMGIVRRFKKARQEGARPYEALVTAITSSLPATAAAVVHLEMYQIYALWLLLRGRREKSLQDEEMAYFRASMPLVAVFTFLMVLEVVAVALLVPWELARTVFLVLSLFGIYWMFGLMASIVAFPHTINDHHLRLRFGAMMDAIVPISSIDSAHRISWGAPSSGNRSEGVLKVKAIGASANVRIQLMAPCDVQMSGPWARGERTRRVSEIRFFADDPKKAVNLVNQLAAS
ncbi:MAG: hypothetical protein KY429_00675 [Actinobacteria bacterium]|nr:hypothetical protein [Actinomycetota bacterium]